MSNREAIEKIESKLASGELTPDYYIRQAIVTRYAENHGGLQLVGGVLVAVVGFSLVGWMGGVGIGLIAAQQMLNWHRQRSKDWEAIDAGKYAHLLTPAEAKHYERIYGRGSLQAAKQGDYSHAGLESDEAIRSGSADAIDVPATPVEDVKTSEVNAKTSSDPTVATDAEDTSLGEARASLPSSKGEAAALPAPIDEAMPSQTDGASPAQSDRFAWAKDLLHFPAVLIWGPQGSGKTSFAAWLLHQRIGAGHVAWVCDPHKEYGQWQGLKVVGAGMDYLDCDRAMLSFANTVKQAYKARSEQPHYKPTRETVLVEEFTNWSSRCENSADFFAAALSDLRKIKKSVIFVAHDRSLVALGNAKGFSKARNNGLLELQLEAAIDPATGEPMPALKGKLKYPGKAAIEVEIAPWMKGEMNFTTASHSTAKATPASTADLLPPTSTSISPEVTSEDVSRLEALYSRDGSESTATSHVGEPLLYEAVKALLEVGKSRTWIIENVLGYRGRRFEQGKGVLDNLLKQFGAEN